MMMMICHAHTIRKGQIEVNTKIVICFIRIMLIYKQVPCHKGKASKLPHA